MQNDAAAFSESVVTFPIQEHHIREKPVLVYSSNSPARDADWLDYLRSLPAKGAISYVAENTAEKIWRKLRPLANNVSVPDAAVTNDGGLFMSWDRGAHHLEIELHPNGRYEWFYRNRSTDNFGGEYDYPSILIPPDLLTQFRLVAEND